MKKYKYIIVVLVVIIGYLIFTRPSEVVQPNEPKWIHDTVRITDTLPVPIYDTLELPKWFRDTITLKDTLSRLDSLRIYNIITDYYTTKTYSDTLKNDSLAFIALDESIRENSIINRSLTYRNNYKPVVLREDKRGLYGFGTVGRNSARLGVIIDLNHRVNYIGGYDVMTGGVFFGVSYLIW